MIRILFLFLGREIILRHWKTLFIIGVCWFLLGLGVFIDALDGDTYLHPHTFAYFLLPEAAISLLAAAGSDGTAKQMRIVQGIALLAVSVLIFTSSAATNFLLALVFGLCFLIDGTMRIASAWVVRFPRWKLGIAGGIFELILAIATLQPWPTWYEGTVGANVGAVLILSSLGIIHVAWRIHSLEAGAPLSRLFGRSSLLSAITTHHHQPQATTKRGELIVHVWTPTGTAMTPLRQRAISRYIAAVDADGVISTGHAALELQPDLYISHYPAVEIDRSPNEFSRTLRATADNNIEGRYLPDYRSEADGWCESTVQVIIKNIDEDKLRAFWSTYKADNTYNLTNRNCSSVVADALDAALEGVYRHKRWPVFSAIRAIIYPELWAASLIRKRAESMAWTPGLVLDYARALSAIVDPKPGFWVPKEFLKTRSE
ncbi:HdeD family acid-resistance protein [Pseudochrobactrum kiredjianiae]|uniref:HdeD family acid-resistance protein n=1 Tax=Pseudochrobactrum kiredjianiae TaxID=386305 RepID=A0ABW3V9W6_9HYPH|nr:protease [Pseudochrobactrum kiredjianiae]MDM7851265.1 protease [Pseudochrobactrum kiredjianiae]